MPGGNTHGSICKIGGQWYVFYHRQIGTDCYARQAMVSAIDVKVEKGKGGKVVISRGEFNSEGFLLEGLNPMQRISAGWLVGTPIPEVSKRLSPLCLHGVLHPACVPG